MQHYTSKTTDVENTEGFRPLADLGARLEEMEAKLEAQLAAEGMPAEIEPAEGPSLDGKLALVTADADATEEIETETGEQERAFPEAEFFPEEDLSPDEADTNILEAIKAHGWAATPAEIGLPEASPEGLARLSAMGCAHLRATATGERVFAMAGATDGDVERAASRLSGQREQAHRAALGSRVHRISRRITARLEGLGGACSEEGVASALVSEGHPREAVKAVISRLEETGGIRRENARWSRHTLLLLPEAGEDEITAASGSLFELARRASRRRHALGEIAKEAR